MVTLVCPRQDESKFVYFTEMFLGPFGDDGSYHGMSEQFGSDTDIFIEEPGAFHENGVIHEHFDGTINFHAVKAAITPYPSSTLPDRVQVPFGVAPNLTISSYGVVGEGAGRLLNTNGTPSRCYAVTGGGNTYKVYRIHFYNSGSNQIVNGLYEWTFTVNSVGPTTASCTVETVTWKAEWFVMPGVDWRQPVSIGTVNATVNTVHTRQKNTPQSRYSTTSSYGLYSLRSSDLSQKQMLDMARFELGMFLQKDTYLPDEKHYGDLAMYASEQVNRTHINVIQFLRDLRRPWELIPKLKNLRSLKGLSENYLKISYGILPTISDLRNILGAFGRIRPNLDRNGFTCYYASHQCSGVVDSTTVEVEQRIKLGIGNEDNAFEALETALESIGLFPSLENIWDLIPYSFVIDWFVNIGEFLERVDTHQRLMRFNVRYATMSRKQKVSKTFTPTSTKPISGTLSLVRYHRWVTDHAPVPPLSLQPSHQGSSHWLEATALIVQRKK